MAWCIYPDGDSRSVERYVNKFWIFVLYVL